MDVSVVTPSFNMVGYLRRCCASVADQEEVRYEHLVVDGGSTDGSAEWLRANPRLIGVIEKDRGMYDAVNKGFKRASGDIVSHLNCDEQYLPGTLAFVKRYFELHPSVDVLFGDALLVRPDGTLIAFRKGFRPTLPIIQAAPPFYLLTATMFIRRRVIEAGELYDDSYKDNGDAELIIRLLRNRYTVRHVRRYLSVYTMTGRNRSQTLDTCEEERRIAALAPWWVRRFRRLWRAAIWPMRLLGGGYFQDGPIVYSLYASDDADSRTTFIAERPSFRWRTA